MNVFNKVTLESLKKNRTRTIVTIIGIMLSAAMICASTTLVSSMQNFVLRCAIHIDGDWYGAVYDAAYKDYEDIRDSDRVSSAAYAQVLGYAKIDSANERKPYLYVLGGDVASGYFKTMPVHLILGTLPKDSTEIILPEHLTSNGKQLRRMVLFEALAVSIVGIPLGILVGIGGIGITLLLIGDIHISADSKLHDAVQGKGHAAEKGEDPSRRSIVALLVAASLGYAEEQSHKHQQHVPHARVGGKEQVAMKQAGRLGKGNGSSQEIIQHHEAMQCPTQFSQLQPRNNQAQIHWDAAQLEWELAPVIGAVRDHIVAEELLKYFRQRQYQTAGKQDMTCCFVADIPQLPCRETADSKANQGKQNMECTVGRWRLHGPGNRFKKGC